MASIRQTMRRMKKTPFFKQNLWDISFELTGSDYETSLAKKDTKKFNEDMSFLAQNVTIPFRSFEYDYDKAYKKHYVKKYNDFDEITISFIETEDLRVRTFLKNWENIKMNTLTGVFRTGQDPKRNMTITYYAFKKSIAASLASRIGGLSIGTVTNKQSGFPAIASPITNISADQLASSVGLELPDLLFDEVAKFSIYGADFVSQNAIELTYEGTAFTRVDVTLKIDFISVGTPDKISEAGIGQALGF